MKPPFKPNGGHLIAADAEPVEERPPVKLEGLRHGVERVLEGVTTTARRSRLQDSHRSL